MFDYYLQFLLSLYKKFLSAVVVRKSETKSFTLVVKNNYVFELISGLKNNTAIQAKILGDICIVDYPAKNERFEVNYNLLSTKYNTRFFVKTYTQAYVQSLTSLFNSANWIERECWDMFGIFFLNHPDLRRILTDYGFDGFPLRKDFPLTGYIEIRYDDEKSNIVYEPLEMSQEYRLFNFTSPWEKIK
jgi:NADH dehydrogenase (ubiquinone) Fe-S protein 3